MFCIKFTIYVVILDLDTKDTNHCQYPVFENTTENKDSYNSPLFMYLFRVKSNENNTITTKELLRRYIPNVFNNFM